MKAIAAGSLITLSLLYASLTAAADPPLTAAADPSRPPQDRQSVPPASEVPSARPILDDEALQREYRDYLSSVKGMRLYRVRYIRLADEAQARDLIARIRSGAGFEEVARKYSIHAQSAANGGDLGTHASCRWGKATLEIFDSLKPGQTWSKPVKGTHGWGIYRLESVVAVQPRSFTQYKAELLSGKFQAECPWVAPVTIAPAPAAGQGLPGQ